MVPLPNPSFEPKIHRWRPGAWAPSWEVRFQICAVLGQKQPFFAQNCPPKSGETPKRREMLATLHVRLLHRVKEPSSAHSTPGHVRETAQKGAKKTENLRNVQQHPETKSVPYLGLRGSNPNSEGT